MDVGRRLSKGSWFQERAGPGTDVAGQTLLRERENGMRAKMSNNPRTMAHLALTLVQMLCS
jgi:hypothetical protein